MKAGRGKNHSGNRGWFLQDKEGLKTLRTGRCVPGGESSSDLEVRDAPGPGTQQVTA